MPEPLGTDTNIVACSRLGTMLYLYIQKGNVAMKSEKLQQDIGETAACMKRIMMAKKWCDQLKSNAT